MKIQISPSCEAQKAHYAENLNNNVISSQHRANPVSEFEKAQREEDCFLEFGDRIDNFQMNGTDPRTLPPALGSGNRVIPNLFLLEFPPWECYFTVLKEEGVALLIFHTRDRPEDLAKALDEAAKLWLSQTG